MTLTYVKDEKRTIKSLCAMIDNAPRMDVFILEEFDLDGTKGNIVILSKALREHPCVEDFHMTSVTLTDVSLTLDEVVSMLLVNLPDLMYVTLEKVSATSSALTNAGCCTSPKIPMDGLPCLENFHITCTALADESLSLDEVITRILDLLPESRHAELETVPVSSSTLSAAVVAPKSDPDDSSDAKPAKAVAQSLSIQSSEILDNDVTDLGCDAFATAPDKAKDTSIQTVHLEGGVEITNEQRAQVETASPKRAGGKAHAA
jgi:hypothetical protein